MNSSDAQFCYQYLENNLEKVSKNPKTVRAYDPMPTVACWKYLL